MGIQIPFVDQLEDRISRKDGHKVVFPSVYKGGAEARCTSNDSRLRSLEDALCNRSHSVNSWHSEERCASLGMGLLLLNVLLVYLEDTTYESTHPIVGFGLGPISRPLTNRNLQPSSF